MPKFKDITGQRFGRLVAIEYVGSDQRWQSLWLCRCDCGSEKIIRAGELSYGHSRSCGCVRREKLITYNTTHGRAHTPTWQSWKGMFGRCYDPKNISYKWYGARGIRVSEQRWHKSFEAFLEDMGERPLGTTLDRINNDGNYEKDNCRWATAKEQRGNQGRPQHKQPTTEPSLTPLDPARGG